MRRDDLVHGVRERLKRLPEPYANAYAVVPLPPPEGGIRIAEVARRHDEAVAAMAKVDALAEEAKDTYFVSRVLTRREAVSSSSIEGTNSTLDELLSVEENVEEQAKVEARQVRDYAVILDKAIPEAAHVGDSIFSVDLICNLHAAIVGGDPDYKDVPGELRTAVVWIGGRGNIAYSTWNPPPPDDVPACLGETVDYLRNEGMQQVNQDLIIRMAVGHAHFEAVHPFRDGNGRIGRILLPLMMAAAGHVPLYLSPYIDAHKADYYAALKAAQQRLEWDRMVGFVSDAIVGTVNELMVTRRALSALREDWLRRRKFRRGSAALRAADLLPDFPIVTAPRLAGMLSVSRPQAFQAIDQLTEVGILKERTGYSRNRVFAASEVLALVNRPFGAEPELPAEQLQGQRQTLLRRLAERYADVALKRRLEADSSLVDDLAIYGSEEGLGALLEAASSLDGNPREFARDYVDGLPEYRS